MLPKQALADQKTVHTGIRQLQHIGMGTYAALGDQETVGRHMRRKLLRNLQAGPQCLEISVVDADQLRFQPQGAVQLVPVMHLGQHVHVQRPGKLLQLTRAGVGEVSTDRQVAPAAA